MKKILMLVVSAMLGVFIGLVPFTVKQEFHKQMIIREINSSEPKNELDKAIKRIYEEYGIVVHKNIKELPSFVISDYDIETGINVSLSASILEEAINVLNTYDEEYLSNLPKNWYLIKSATVKKPDDKFTKVNAWVGNYGVVISVEHFEGEPEKIVRVLNHEIFHTIADKYWSKTDFDNFKNIDEDCSAISNYACTNKNEEVAEAWSYGLLGLQTEKTNYILNEYGYYLK